MCLQVIAPSLKRSFRHLGPPVAKEVDGGVVYSAAARGHVPSSLIASLVYAIGALEQSN